ncbi:MAG: threonylcarbamoyl-AMP synthase [Sphingobacteriaceae bacterium]|nr:threonylcarbamoyl-AMP synthase [Sphingobacteriaceae bacterium]
MLKEEIKKALAVLKNGGVILYPTDTVWGLGCDATNAEAIEKINKIKGRSEDKSFIILLDVDTKLASYVSEIPEVAYDLIEFSENPLTIIFDGAKNLAQNAINKDGSIGIRVVKHDFCTELLQQFRKPIVSTSANLSGEKTPAIFDEIDPKISAAVDYIIDWEQELQKPKKPSTIMKLTASGQFTYIRK